MCVGVTEDLSWLRSLVVGDTLFSVPADLLPRYVPWTLATGTWCHGNHEATRGRDVGRGSLRSRLKRQVDLRSRGFIHLYWPRKRK